MEKYWCSSCKKETKQNLDYKDDILETIEIFKRGSSRSAWLVGHKKIFISTCLGCDTKNLNIRNEHTGPNGTTTIEEKDSSDEIIPKKWIFELENKNIFELLIEVYNAANGNLNRLAVMGIRSLIDYYLNAVVGDVGGFSKKLTEAKNKNILSEQQHNILSLAVEAGNSVTHRENTLDKKDIFEIINVIESIFYQEVSLSRLKIIESRIPKRKEKKQK